MSEWTPYNTFASVTQDSVAGGTGWDNVSAIRTVDDNPATVDLFGSGAASYSRNIELSDPKAASLVPQGSTIERIAFQISAQGPADAGNRVALKGFEGTTDINLGTSRQTYTVDKTLAQLGWSQQDAQAFLYSGQQVTFFIDELAEVGPDHDTRVYWVTCRIQFTRPPNVPRTAFMVMF